MRNAQSGHTDRPKPGGQVPYRPVERQPEPRPQPRKS